ncbi:MAG: pseudouridine synthase family protein [Pseudonocardiaceae bacterium]
MNDWSEIRSQCVVWEDGAALVLNKSAGISVMGERHETDIIRMAQEAGEKLWWVHRIDKVTSGAVLLAKRPDIHGDLTRQFSKRAVDKAYFVITRSGDLPSRGSIDLPLMTAGSGRVRVAAERADIEADVSNGRWYVPSRKAFTHTKTYSSRTNFAKLWEDEYHTVLLAQPITGRRHQIRVHLAWIGYAIEGDPLFDGKSASQGSRTCLHSWHLAFEASWAGGVRVEVEAAPGNDFWAPILGRLPGGDPAAVMASAHELIRSNPR